MKKAAFALLSSVALAADLSRSDLVRAYQPKPLPHSHVVGSDPTSIFSAMNDHLQRQPHHTQACEDFTHDELNELARLLWGFRSGALSAIYDKAQDNRKFHFDVDDASEDGLSYKEKLWAQESLMAAATPAQHGPGSEHHAMVRDGKCAELVMWWIHHLSQESRTKLCSIEGFAVPLLPASPTKPEAHNQEYIYQVTCSDCHSTGIENTTQTTTNTPVPRSKDSVGDIPPGTCPTNTKTKLPTVWYQPMSDVGNRLKRCDWDYDPPCGLCEGIGGYSWGDQQHQISYTSCSPVALAKDIPLANITTPSWPEAFVVDEVTTLINQISTGGQFPGADPCEVHKFTNDSEVLYYDDSRANFNGPIMYTKASKSDIYTLPTADMFIKIAKAFCICVTPVENGNHTAAPTGPLVHDFARDAVLIGREIIGLEGLDTNVTADHWNKGPHHFWIDVKTNLFVRGWQPWNGLNVYKPGTWKVGPVDKEHFAVPKSCYSGFLHKNISCIAPYP